MNTGYIKIDDDKYVLLDDKKGPKNVDYLNEERLLLLNKREYVWSSIQKSIKNRQNKKHTKKMLKILLIFCAVSALSNIYTLVTTDTIFVANAMKVFIAINGTLIGTSAYLSYMCKRDLKDIEKYEGILVTELEKVENELQNTKEVTSEKVKTMENGKIVSLNQKNIELLERIKRELIDIYDTSTYENENVKKLKK